MIRLIVRKDNAGMAANCGGDVLTTYHTFEIDLPAMENLLALQGENYMHAQLVGAEIVKQAPHD